MDGRDRTTRLIISGLPEPLSTLIGYYSDTRRCSKSRAVIELLETHPVVAELISRLYNSQQSTDVSGGNETNGNNGDSVLADVLRR